MNKYACLIFVLATGTAAAQTAVPAYEGGGFAWDYPSGVANHAGFKLSIDGVTATNTFAKDVREVKFADTALKGQALGKTYTVKFIATATPPAQDSDPATLVIDYKKPPKLDPPTNTRTILEWVP